VRAVFAWFQESRPELKAVIYPGDPPIYPGKIGNAASRLTTYQVFFVNA
jgi:hypothetical protein